MKGIQLKRSLLCFAMVFCIVFSLCGCKKNNAEEEETSAETTLSTQATEQTTLQSQSEKKETTTKITTQTAAQTPTMTETTAKTTTPTAAETTAQTTAPMTKATTQKTAKQTTTQTTKKETTKTTAKTTEETTETTLQTLYYPEEELDAMAENMPEIVFVMSLYINTRRNIFGYFVTNTGEIKMFDFEPIAPGEFYDIQDVYDRLDEAVCDEFPKDVWKKTTFLRDDPITNDDLDPIPEEELKEKYKTLLCIDENCEYWVHENAVIGEGCYNAYGVRYDQNNEKEILLLYGMGWNVYEREDDISSELYCWLKWDAFPGAPFPT